MSDNLILVILVGFIGFISGFLSSIPTGPIGITIINEGARRGFRWAAMIGLGAIAMEFIYCVVAFAGFSGLLGSDLARASMELLSFLATLYLGIKYMFLTRLPETPKSLEVVEQKLHPHTAFMIGFVRVLGNPAVLLFWVTLAAAFIAHRVVDDTFLSKAVCVIGMSIGALTWFLLLAYIVSRKHGRFSSKSLVRLSHVSGAALLLVAFLIGIRLVSLLSKPR